MVPIAEGIEEKEMSKWKWFNKEEFSCPDCGENGIKDELIDVLDRIRDKVDMPMIITSGWRCKKHNAEVGGKPSSAHLTGEAADVACEFDRTRYLLIKAALEEGIKRIGVGKDFLHFDISTSLPGRVIWEY